MGTWVDVRSGLPWLRGVRVHVVPAAREAEVRRVLDESGFELREMDGAAVRDPETLFRGLARALQFPAWFGHNWDALNDSLGELTSEAGRPMALLWTDAQVLLEADLQTAVDAVLALDAAVGTVEGAWAPRQLETFLVQR